MRDSLETWRRDGNVRRLWAGDAGLWTGADEAKWLGWLSIVEKQRKRVGSLSSLAEDIRQQGFSTSFSSAWVDRVSAQRCLPRRSNVKPAVRSFWCSIRPIQRRSATIESKIDPARTLFIVSSKSGSTLEPNILKQYFFECVTRAVGVDQAGSRFVAITDPGSTLQTIAEADGSDMSRGIPSIGGRYSVLSDFGLVPAAAMGLDIASLLSATDIMVRSCAANVPPAHNPGVVLGTVLGRAGEGGPRQGHDHRLARHCRFRRVARAAAGRVDRQARQGTDPGRSRSRWERPMSTATIACSSMSGCQAKPDAKQDDAVDCAGSAQVIRLCASRVARSLSHRPGILSLGVRDGRCRFNPRHQSVRSARRRGEQGSRRVNSPTAYERTGELPSETAPLSKATVLRSLPMKRTRKALGKAGHTGRISQRHTSDAFAKATIARSSPMSNATSAIATHCRISVS